MLLFTPREPFAVSLRRDLPWALGIFALGLAVLVVWPDSVIPGLLGVLPAMWQLVPLVIACAAAAVTSALPTASLLVASVGVASQGMLGTGIMAMIAWSQAIHAVWRYGSDGERRRGLVVLVVTAVLVLAGTWFGELARENIGGLALQLALMCAIPMWWSSELRAGDEVADAERLRAESIEREAEFARAQAVQAERESVARELHDTVSAHLSTIAIFSGAALDAAPGATARDEKDQRTLTEVRRASLAALGDMRQLIDVLRSDVAAPEPATTLAAELAAAEGRVEARGLSPDALAAAPAAVFGAVAREALANALKYGDSTVALDLREEGGMVQLEITNPIAVRGGVGSSGIGLGQMARRVSAADGRFGAGAETDASGRAVWRVRAEVPA